MEKIITKRWKWIVLGMTLFIYFFGLKNMYFHQDDLDWFLLARKPLMEIMSFPIADHINYVFRILLKTEWQSFGMKFPPYLLVSQILHLGVIYYLYQLSYMTTKRRDLAAVAAVLYTVNTNWTEVVLWIAGQTISITVLFVVVAMITIYRQKKIFIPVLLASMTSALAIGLPIATLLTYGIEYQKRRLNRTGYQMLVILLMIWATYKFHSTDGTPIIVTFAWLIRVIEVFGLAIINTLIGRLVLPFDRFEVVRIIAIVSCLMAGAWMRRRQIYELLKDAWVRFLVLQIGFYYLIVAAGRAQYGVGIMRAERYAYLGLALALLLIVRIWQKKRIGKWIYLIGLLIIMQSVSFYTRASAYFVRPQQLKSLVTHLQNGGSATVSPDDYLPHYVLNDERLKYRDLLLLLND